MDRHVPRNLQAGWIVAARATVAICLLLAGGSADTAPVQTTRFKNYSVDDGLSQSSVTALIQDRQGYIWIGTEDGLNRFDGYEFARFGQGTDAVGALPDGGVTHLLEGIDGTIWIGTITSGLRAITPSNGAAVTCETGNSLIPDTATARVRGIALDASHAIWAIAGNTVYRQVGPCQFVAAGRAATDGDFTPAAIVTTADGSIWTWSQEGDLWRSDAGDPVLRLFRRFDRQSYGGRQVRAVAGGRTDLWVALDGPELFRLDADGTIAETVVIPAATSMAARIRALHADPAGDVWVAGLGIGLVKVRPGQGVVGNWRHDSADPASLVHNDSTVLLADRSGGLWIGTRSHGVSRVQVDPEGFAHYRHSANNPAGISDNMVTVFAERGQDGLVWVGMDGGGLDLLDFDAGVIRRYRHDADDPGSLSSDRVWALHEDAAGRLWVGTWFGGLSMLEPGAEKFRRFPSEADPVNSAGRVVLTIAESGDGTLWFGTMSFGLYRVGPGSERFEPVRVSSPDATAAVARISSLLVDREQRLWVGTWDNGVSRLDPASGNYVHFGKGTDSRSLPHDTVRALAEDGDGAIWVGTLNGLARLDPVSGDVDVFGPDSGLPPGTIYAILPDRDTLWVSSNRGLAHIDPRTRTARQFGPADGLQGFEFNGGAALKTRDGRMLFGGTQGFNAFYPQDIRPNPFPPQVAITRIAAQDRVLDLAAYADADPAPVMRFAYDENRLSFDFAGLHFTSPERIRYAYRLEGLQEDWLTADASRRVAGYANLAPGQYSFRVRAANKDGLWSRSDAVFAFSIGTPWWLTGPAYATYAVAVLACVFLLIQWRTLFLRRRAALLAEKVREGTRRIAEQKQTIEKQAENLQHLLETKDRLFARVSHEFRTPLTLILGPVEAMRKRVGGTDADSLDLVSRNARRLLRLVEQLLDLARLSGERPARRDTVPLDQLLATIVGAFRSLAEQKDIALELRVEARPSVSANAELLESAVTNLVANALKFTPAGGRIEVALGLEGEQAWIRVSDSGPGVPAGMEDRIFDPFERADSDLPGTGIGLAVVRETVASIDGTIHVGRAEIGGAEFTLRLPVTTSLPTVAYRLSRPPQVDAGWIADTCPDMTARSDAVAGPERPRVLVVEDDADLRAFIGQCLADDFECILMPDGASALACAIEEVPDLVLSDVMMPGIDGFELTRKLRQDERCCHIPIVLLTAREDRESLYRGLTEKADEYLTKPFDAEELRLRLHNLIDVRAILRRQAAAEWRASQAPGGSAESVPPAFGPRDQAFLQRLANVVAERFGDNAFGVRQLAAAVAMSDRQLQRKVQALLDVRPADYLRDYRLQQAARMLADGRPAGTVAQDCGFATQAHFGQCFKARYGVTPGDYARPRPGTAAQPADGRHPASDPV
ncbi:MAG: response regulator [Gammaproteobacteria bacterium]|nr:response regulator [Gammaproteobacteria bacterium]MDH4254935.1 response regulator [Gammaproteobacteria bacterium]